MEGTRVVVLYPSGKVSDIQEKQFTTLGQNVTALEIEGTFDDCQKIVKQAFVDKDLTNELFLTSANSINIARLIPQSFYYFHAYAQLQHLKKPMVFSVPSGNFGNLTGGLLAKRMGLPIQHFVAATNVNDVVPEYLATRTFQPRPSLHTMSNAMDVGNPSNFHRMLDLFDGNFERLSAEVSGYAFSDDQTKEAMQKIFSSKKYVMDPHGAVAYLGLKKYLDAARSGSVGVFAETAHPAKFKEVVDVALNTEIAIPAGLQKFLSRRKKTVDMPNEYQKVKAYLLENFAS